MIFKTDDNFDTDIKTGIEGLVKQLNTQWSVLTDRMDAVEKFEKGFINNTLHVLDFPTDRKSSSYLTSLQIGRA